MLSVGILSLVLFIGLTHGASLTPQASTCRCVTDQWQAILASTDREFDLRGGRTGSLENRIYVSYDFKNKKFAMTDLNTGNRAIADYGKGYKYVIRDDGCRQIGTMEEMKKMCLPDHAEHGGQFRLGEDLAVDLWEFSAPYNMSMKTTVLRKDCVPVTEEVFMTQGNFASMTSSMYLDVTLGIKDEQVFEAPISCVYDSYRHRMNKVAAGAPQMKRSGTTWGLMHMFNDQDLQTK